MQYYIHFPTNCSSTTFRVSNFVTFVHDELVNLFGTIRKLNFNGDRERMFPPLVKTKLPQPYKYVVNTSRRRPDMPMLLYTLFGNMRSPPTNRPLVHSWLRGANFAPPCHRVNQARKFAPLSDFFPLAKLEASASQMLMNLQCGIVIISANRTMVSR